MKTDLRESPATPPPAANGTHRAARKSARSPKRSDGSRDLTPAGPEPPAAAFAATEAAPIDAEMWPLHAAMWLQPERVPSVSQWSGLTVEHRYRLPAPTFLQPIAAPLNPPASPDVARDARIPFSRPAIPQSDLAPLGWDPRAICRKEEGE